MEKRTRILGILLGFVILFGAVWFANLNQPQNLESEPLIENPALDGVSARFTNPDTIFQWNGSVEIVISNETDDEVLVGPMFMEYENNGNWYLSSPREETDWENSQILPPQEEVTITFWTEFPMGNVRIRTRVASLDKTQQLDLILAFEVD